MWSWKKIAVPLAVGICAAGTITTASIVNANKNESFPLNPQMINVNKSPKNNSLPISNVNFKHKQDDSQKLIQTIERARQNCIKIKEQYGLPGLSVAVSVNGRPVWQEGFGFADLENGVEMKPQSVIRIASISKSMTMAMMAKLIEEGKIDIDAPIQKYLPNFPEKTFDGEKVVITTRHLLSHLSGIRHYQTKAELDKKKEEGRNGGDDDGDLVEFYMKTGCESVEKALDIFKNDELIHKPGTKYFYSTHAWTVISAIIEKLTETTFPKHCRKMFDLWGLQNTYLDEHEPIIYNRARHYSKDKNGKLINSPYVDNSCKWAGGGFLSTVEDLINFSHIMLYSLQQPEIKTDKEKSNCSEAKKIAFLKRETVNAVWTGNALTVVPHVDNLYGLGFVIGEPFLKCLYCKERQMKMVSHSGGACGATSILLMQYPVQTSKNATEMVTTEEGEVKGIVVAMITNLINAGLSATAQKIADEFKWMV